MAAENEVKVTVTDEGLPSNAKSKGFLTPEPKLAAWEPENESFWKSDCIQIAYRNLFVSMFNLLLGFAIWLMWSIIVVKIQLVHDEHGKYKFEEMGDLDPDEYKALLYTLPAIAGLSGGTFRIPNSFMIMPLGGRLVVSMTTLLLAIPCLVGYSELRKEDASYWTLVIAAALSGVGGGAFASSMSNISFYFPKSQQGMVLGINGGLGNLGVSLSQVFCPLVMGYAAFGATNVIGGLRVYNGLMWWFPFCCVFGVLAWLWMSDMPQHGNKPMSTRLLCYISMQGNAYIACGVAVAVFVGTAKTPAFTGSPGGKICRIFILVLTAAILMHLLMWFASPKDVKDKLTIQVAIFKNKHTYIMTWLYLMCFGSFIGYSGAFPKLILDLFGYINDENGFEIANPNAPSPQAYAFLGPLIGSLLRPVGGWLADKYGGALVTQIDLAVMIVSTIAVGIVVQMAYDEPANPEKHFPAFFTCFMVLFATTGIANGSTFKQIADIFLGLGLPEQSGPVLGWSSAIASYGAIIIPGVLGVGILEEKVPANMYGFAGYYITCFFLNGFYYLNPFRGDTSKKEAGNIEKEAENGVLESVTSNL